LVMARKSPAAILKSKGLIPKDWNPAKLNRGQKSWVTKLTRKPAKDKPAGPLFQLIRHPDEYSFVKAATRGTKKTLKGAGYTVTNGKAIVRTGKGGSASYRNGKLTTNGQRKTEVWFAGHKDFLKKLAKAKKRKLRPNQVWTQQIGNSPPGHHYRSLEDLERYVSNIDEWAHRADARDHVSLVLITENRSHIIMSLSTNENDEDEGEE
jgi:hypothetical protein